MDKESNKDLAYDGDIADELLKRLIFLRDSGVDYLPMDSETPLVPLKSKPAVVENFVEAECTRCELSKDRDKVVVGLGEKSKVSLMIVGGSPSKIDNTTGKPFSGLEGELLDKIIKAMGLSKDDVFLCYSVRCYSELEVSEEHKSQCIVNLSNDFLRIKPKAVLSFGPIASEAVKQLGFDKTFSVPALKAMQVDESLKLETWDTVRKVMKIL